MDWAFAIERNREALRGVLATLLAMAGLRGRFAPEAQSCRASGATAGGEGRDAAGGSGDPAGRPPEAPDAGCARPTLPRHLHRAVLRLLRPAEAAARRLVIAAARGLVVPLPHPRPGKPKPAPPALRPGAVTGVWMPLHLRPGAARPLSDSRRARPLRASALSLFDPLPRRRGPKRTVACGVPRLCTPGWSAPHPVPPERRSKGRPPLGPDDPIDAARLALRLQALGRALDDLPREARRFARWRAARDAAGAQTGSGGAGMDEARRSGPARARRVWPLRPGRPLSLSRRAGQARRPHHAVHEILSDAHALAIRSLERLDSS